jgi:hypothetical protein
VCKSVSIAVASVLKCECHTATANLLHCNLQRTVSCDTAFSSVFCVKTCRAEHALVDAVVPHKFGFCQAEATLLLLGGAFACTSALVGWDAVG